MIQETADVFPFIGICFEFSPVDGYTDAPVDNFYVGYMWWSSFSANVIGTPIYRVDRWEETYKKRSSCLLIGSWIDSGSFRYLIWRFADLSHSERAVALKQHLDALKNSNGGQGRRNDLLSEIEMLSNPDNTKANSTSALLGEKLFSVEKVGMKYGLSKNSVARYVRISYLIEPLLERLNNDEIGLYPAVSLSYLSPDEQTELNAILTEKKYKVDMKKAEVLRDFSENKKLTPDKIIQILSGELNKKTKTKLPATFKIKYKLYTKYFDEAMKQDEVESIIDKALDAYFKNSK